MENNVGIIVQVLIALVGIFGSGLSAYMGVKVALTRIETRQDAPAYSCTYTGTLAQAGRMSDATGNYSCSDGTSGPFELREIEVSKRGFLGNLSAMQNGCRVYGNLGGARATVEQAPD